MWPIKAYAKTSSIWNQFFISSRLIAVANYATRKRFYKNTGILYSNGKYEITLDQRKLKTPTGKSFYVESEPLALAISAEWDSQPDILNQSSMHLTALSNTVLDNPNYLNKVSMVDHMVNILMTDTLLFQCHENDALYELQVKEWDPVIQWFCDRFSVDIKKTRGFDVPVISDETRGTLTKHFLSYDFASVHGFIFGIDTLKSVILMLATVERYITPEKAVYLSRLEEEHQLKYWGRVEWSHDLSQQDSQSRLSAAVLFIYFNSSGLQKRTKSVN